MSDDVDDLRQYLDNWKRQMREMSEANAQMLANLKQMLNEPNQSEPCVPSPYMIDQQNQFRERIDKFKELSESLKK